MNERFSKNEENLKLHGLNLFPQFGATRLFRLCKYFGSASKAFEASASALAEAGIERDMAEKFAEFRKNINLEGESEKLQREKINLVSFKDAEFPALLLEIPKFPALLYYKGTLDPNDELRLAIVGTRKISTYGQNIMPALVEPLIDSGLTVVSGLAFGVDSAVAKMAVDKGRRTIAVLGGGLDEKSFYPKDHTWLAERVLETGGALISEYPPLTPPLKHHFVARNRIISGLSLGTLIIECSLKSGSLITAQFALEQNRAVYAVPGPIYAENSKGPNNLIKMGARLVTEAKDILEDLNVETLPQQQQAQSIFSDSPAEAAVLGLLSHEPVHINEIIKLCRLEAAEVTSALTFLEMKGKIRNLGAQQYTLSR